VLKGLSQKATWWVQGLKFPLSWAANTTGGKKEPNLSIAVKQAEHGKPVIFLIEDGAAVRLRYRVAGKGWWKKRTPVCN